MSKKGVIYTLRPLCLDTREEEPHLLYVGSTINPIKRKNAHRFNASIIKNIQSSKLYSSIHSLGGFDNWEFTIVETINFNDRLELYKCENKWLELLKPSINKNKAPKMPTICVHNRKGAFCKLCRGAAICQHDKQKAFCVECKGSQICTHNLQRHNCSECFIKPVMSST